MEETSLMRIGAIIMAVGLVAAACSSSPAPASPGASVAAPSVAAPSVAAPSVAAPSVAAEPVELTVLTWDQGGTLFWDQVVKDFNAKYPNITVKREVVPYDQYVDKLGLYRTAGAGPDVLTITAGSYLLGFSDIMLPLNGLIDDPTTTSNGASGGCQDFDCSKEQYGGIVTGQAHPIYFNKAVLTEAGLDPANPPESWKDMDAACGKIKAIGKACIATGGKDFGGLTQFLALLQETSTLEQCQGLQSGTTKATDPWFVAAFALYEDMAKRGWFQDGAIDANLAPEAQDLFTSGGAGFYTGLLSEVYAWKQLGDILGDDLGVGLSPAI